MSQSEIKDELQCDPLVIRQAISTDITITEQDKEKNRHAAAVNSQKRNMK